MLRRKHADNYTGYEFLLEHLYNKPKLYEVGFRKVRGYVMVLQNFITLPHLLEFISARPKDIRDRLKRHLITLSQTHKWLRPEIIEILMFVLWDDLKEQYGTGERFSESYWDLINEMEPQIAQIGGDNNV
jgi:hypothetical protein